MTEAKKLEAPEEKHPRELYELLVSISDTDPTEDFVNSLKEALYKAYPLTRGEQLREFLKSKIPADVAAIVSFLESPVTLRSTVRTEKPQPAGLLELAPSRRRIYKPLIHSLELPSRTILFSEVAKLLVSPKDVYMYRLGDLIFRPGGSVPTHVISYIGPTLYAEELKNCPGCPGRVIPPFIFKAVMEAKKSMFYQNTKPPGSEGKTDVPDVTLNYCIPRDSEYYREISKITVNKPPRTCVYMRIEAIYNGGGYDSESLERVDSDSSHVELRWRPRKAIKSGTKYKFGTLPYTSLLANLPYYEVYSGTRLYHREVIEGPWVVLRLGMSDPSTIPLWGIDQP